MTEKRNGPGRPRINNSEKTQPYTISLTPTEAEIIRKFGDGNLTEGIRKAIDSMNQERIEFSELQRKYGTVVYENKVYWLAEVADFSNRPFAGWWGDAQEGEAYTTEFSCRAYDSYGDGYIVYWQFDAIKGQEPEDNSNWPWSEERITRVVSE